MILIVVGLAMTAVMQSSTAAIAVTISAFYAGAVSLEQGAALIIGQNIGTATSSALAAIGASTTAKRLALAYVLFKLIAALIAVIAFPFTSALMKVFKSVDGMTLLAAYHTAYNVVGVAVLLPAAQWFTRSVERLLPSKQTALQRALDPSALANPVIAVETARRVVADVLTTMAGSVSALFSGGVGPAAQDTAAAVAALEEVRDFLSELKEPPETEAERLRLTSTLHALDHALRLAEVLREDGLAGQLPGPTPDLRAAELCKQALHAAQAVGGSITSESALSAQAAPIGWSVSSEVAVALAEMEGTARELDALQRDHRTATLASVVPGELSAADAFARIEAVRRLTRISHRTWRSAAHLLGRGARDNDLDPWPQPASTASGGPDVPPSTSAL